MLQEDSLLNKYLRIFFVVAAYWTVSISLVFINKALLSGHSDTLDAPLFVTWFQCVVTVALCILLANLAKIFPRFKKIPPVSLDYEMMIKVLPLSVLFVVMISFNNLCLKYVGVAFYYVGRSLIPVFNVVISWVLLGERTSIKAILCCCLIIAGFGMGVDQENLAGSLSPIGTIFGILSSLFVSLASIYTKKVLPHVNQSVWLLGYYNNINACFLFIPLMLMNGEITELVNFTNFSNLTFWLMMVAGGVFGFAIGYVSGLQIQATSPLTHNISGTAKSCAQTLLATYWYSESKQWLWWMSNWVILLGSAVYTWVRQVEMEKNHHKALKLNKL